MARRNDYIAKIDKFIGNKIVSLRLARGLSRKQLSEAVGITGQQLSKYEKGKNKVSIGRLILLSKALGERVSYFYEGLETEVTYQLPIDQEQMCRQVVRNFGSV
ncbi:MAG TPA: helix-turn-helix transcriptional regulator [Candidatus Megaira endosymbiont of Stentor roeselii]|nr:helix-turn-helix transcriptional regulator [Candidatus Megaera endosymbiont of Stentor roeselii]